MSRLGLVDRVRSWFGGTAAAEAGLRTPVQRWSPVSLDGDEAIDLVESGAIASVAAEAKAGTPDGPGLGLDTRAPGGPETLSVARPAGPSAEAASCPGRIDPLDPAWMQSLGEHSGRTSEAAVRRLDQIAFELEGHRQAGLSLVEAIRRMPDLATNQAELARETNRILGRQTTLAESMFDAVVDLRAAYKTVEDTSRRQLTALDQLETSHREVLYEYQDMLLKAYRRLGHLALLGTVLGASAVGALTYVLYLMHAAGMV